MSSGNIDSSLLELFREEVRGQVNTLNNGLVELEQNADPRQVEPLMRAAHSIKGAARLVGVDPAVKVAHAMEDCLVAVQRGQLALSPAGIDALLAGTDWLSQFGENAGAQFASWYAPHEPTIANVIARLEQVLAGEEPAENLNTNTALSETTGVVDSAPLPAVPVAVGNAPVVWKLSQPSEIEPGVLALFHEEMQTNLTQLREGLTHLAQAKAAPATTAQLLQAAKWVHGSALLLRIEPLAQLASLFDQALQALRPTEQVLPAEACRTLQETLQLESQLAFAVGQDFPATVKTQTPAIAQLFNELSNLARLSPPVAVAEPESKPLAKKGERNRPANPAPAETVLTPPTKTAANEEPEDAQERVVRVTAKNLTRLMGLAGESLVEARWLQPFALSLVNLKREQDRLADSLDELAQAINTHTALGTEQILAKEMRLKLLLLRNQLASRIEEFESHARRSDDLNSRLYNEVIASRMRPMNDGVQGYPRMVRDIARQLNKSVRFEIQGENTPVDRDVLEKLDAPLNHILRNALDHGIETTAERLAAGKPEQATLTLEARHSAGMLAITISDDGRGIDLEKLRKKIVERKLTTHEMAARMTDAELYEFLFLPGFSTRGQVTELSGRGVGLDVVHTMATSVGGTVRVQSQLGRGTSFHMNLPITLSVIRAVLVDIAGEPYAFPLNRIDRLLRVSPESLGSLEHRQFLRVDGQNVGIVMATQILRMAKRPISAKQHSERDLVDTLPFDQDLFVVLFSNHGDQYGLLVDGFLGEQDLVVRPLDHRLGKVPNVSAAAVLDDGSPALIIDVDDVRRAIERLLESGKLERTDEGGKRNLAGRKKRVLVVDDSITVREVERQLLTSRGYDVTVAVDGADGWNTIREADYDLVISDIDMPHMNGLEFTRKIKDDAQLNRIPVVIVSYKDREEDRLRGLEAGANYYLTKSSFHDESLLEAVHALIGEAQ